ncbi:MAG: 3-dehydroquinate synthase [Spirochaetes bacterium]|nr:3-dehydroquinate synthase [Spirochaetota bacterium]
MKEVNLNTGGSSYRISTGRSIVFAENQFHDLLSKKDRVAVIVSSRILELYDSRIKGIFRSYNNCDFFPMKDGEENKNYKYAEKFLNDLLSGGYSRNSAIVGIGGGVTGDFAGFIASVYMRGISLIHVPTTLLAMVDSSIGGKVAVNISAGKNIVGSFYQPEMVLSDTDFIQTLPENEFKNGITEVLKHAIIGEEKLLTILEENNLKSLRESDNVEAIVYLSALFKAKVVEKDEKEGGLRAILNFGHTVGHAIESLLEYKTISHGEAVAIGLLVESEISERIGWLTEQEKRRVADLISKYDLIYNKYKVKTNDILEHMKYDKKNTAGKINFVLLKGLNNPVYNQNVDIDLLKDVLGNLIF